MAMEEKMTKLEKQLDRILFILESDPKTNQKGLVESFDELNDTVHDLVRREQIYRAKATVWGVVGGGIISILVAFGKILATKIF